MIERKDKFRRGARFHYDVTPWTKYVQSYWKNGIEAYVTPVSGKSIEVAFLWDDRLIERETPLLDFLLSIFPEINHQININKVTDFKAYGPFKNYSKNLYKGNVIFLGDAYRFVDGITGEGLSVGFKSAAILSEGINRMNLFKVWLTYLQYFVVTKFVLALSRSRVLKRWAILILKKNSSIINLLMSINDYSFISYKK